MEISLKGRVALVCGGSRGIGGGIALELARSGADLALLARDRASLDANARRCQELGARVHVIAGDVADPELPERAVGEVERSLGRLDILVNNAGGPPMGSLLEHDTTVWDAAYRRNLFSVVAFTRAAVMRMRERSFGRIVNITSYLGKEPAADMVLSSTFRAGVSSFAKAVSTELISHGITINTVAPAAVLTERAESLTRQTADKDGIAYEEALRRATESLPPKRFATREELASLVVYLASELAGYITGTTVLVDGGLSKATF